MEHRGVKGSACGYVRLLWEPKPQSRLPTSYNSAIHQTYNTCKSFPLCFPHFFSPSFPTPRVHLLTLHIIQMWLPKPWTTLKIIQKINFFSFLEMKLSRSDLEHYLKKKICLKALIVKMCQFKKPFQDIHAAYSRRYLFLWLTSYRKAFETYTFFIRPVDKS